MVTCPKTRESGNQTNHRTPGCLLTSTRHTFRVSQSPQRSTATHADVTLTKAECLIDCKGVTIAQWLCWGDAAAQRWYGVFKTKVKKWRPIHLTTEYNETVYTSGGSGGNIRNNDAS